MDDIGGLILAVIAIGIVIAIVKFTYYLAIFLFSNIIVFFDNILGGLIFVPPYISWALVGFMVGTLLYFAVNEAGKLSRPNIRPILIGIACFLPVITFLIGQLGSQNIRKERHKFLINREINTPGTVLSGDYEDYLETGKEYLDKKGYEKALRSFETAKGKKDTPELQHFIEETQNKINISLFNTAFEKYKKEKNFDGMLLNLAKLRILEGKSIDTFDLLMEISVTGRNGLNEMSLSGIPFVYIEPGKFRMGCFNPNDRELLSDANPIHEVELSGYWMSKTEITEAQFRNKKSTMPACYVSWFEAVNFAKKFGNSYGIKGNLPTEAQWEFAARNRGQEIVYPWGNEINKTNANYRDTGGIIMSVESFSPNPLGLFNISGNLREWCRDSYSEIFYSQSNAGIKNPLCTISSNEAVIRGGCYEDGEFALKTYIRYSRPKNSRDQFTGFRVVLER